MMGRRTTTDAPAHGAIGAIAYLLALIGALAYCYYDVIGLLVYQWWTKDFYSYAFLIPVISGYLAWIRRDRILAALGAPSYLVGVATLAAAVFALHLGRAASFAMLQEATLPLAVAGVIALAAGRRALRVAWLPVAYLYFAVPVWDVFTDNLHLPFQLMAATMGQELMRLAGVPSLRLGTVLQLPSVTLEVARACSGVNYLVSVVAVSVPYAYLTLSSNLRRAAVGVFAVAVAILSNGIRVALIGILQFYGLSSQAELHGPAHTLQGMFVAVVGYAALFFGVRFLEDRRAPRDGAGAPSAASWRPRWLPIASALALLLAGGILRSVAATLPVAATAGDPLPAIVGAWDTTAESSPGAVVSWSEAEQSASRFYSAQGIGSLQLYIGYLSCQMPGRKLVGDGGMTLPDPDGTVTVQALDGTTITAGKSERKDRLGVRRVTLYRYDLNGHQATNPYWVKLLTVWNAMVHRRSDGAVVVIVLTLDASTSVATGRAALYGFVANIAPSTRMYFAPRAVRR